MYFDTCASMSLVQDYLLRTTATLIVSCKIYESFFQGVKWQQSLLGRILGRILGQLMSSWIHTLREQVHLLPDSRPGSLGTHTGTPGKFDTRHLRPLP